MSLNANALLTTADASVYLRAGSSAADQAAVEDAINRVSDFAESYCCRPLVQRVHTNLRLRGCYEPKLYLKHAPIRAISGVTYNDQPQTVWSSEADGLPSSFDVVLAADDPYVQGPNHLWRTNGWVPLSAYDPYCVLIGMLTAGYDPADSPSQRPIPGNLREAALLLVQKFYRDQSRQLAEVASVTSPDGQLQMFDTVHPRRARDILDSFRVWTVG